MTTLMAASNEWANRPADERFKSLAELDAAVRSHRAHSRESKNVDLRSLQVIGDDGGVPKLIGKTGAVADFTHYAFGQLCRRIGAPAGYLRQLPTSIVCDAMNVGLAKVEPREDGAGDNLLWSVSEVTGNENFPNLKLRAALSPAYQRIWNSDITSRLIRLSEQSSFQPAPEAFDGSRGLYASDKDMFAFLVDNNRRIFETDKNGGLGRGFFVSNSEVGDAAFKLTTFFYEYVCGNHRVWGAQGVTELRIRHIGNADERAFSQLAIELRKYADSSAEQDEQKIIAMRRMELGADKDAVLDAVFNLGLPRKTAAKAYEVAVQREDWYGNPRSVWGFTGGLTEIARDLPNADERVALERQAGKIMQVAF